MSGKDAPPDFETWHFLESHPINITITNKNTGKRLKIIWEGMTADKATDGMVLGTTYLYQHPKFFDVRGQLHNLQSGIRLAEWGFEDESDKWQSAIFVKGRWRILEKDQKIIFVVKFNKSGEDISFSIVTRLTDDPKYKKHFELELSED